MRASLLRLIAAGLLAGAVLAGCDRDADPQPSVRAADESPALDGMTPEEIEERAVALPPEQAEELGVMDTTIQVGDEP